MKSKIATLICLLSLLITSCDSEPKHNVSAESSYSEEVRIPINEKSFPKVHFTKKREFGCNEEVFLGGISSFIVDEDGNVFIADNTRGYTAIHAFDAKGNYSGRVGNYGRGPGEYLLIGDLIFRNDELLVFDPDQSRLLIYKPGSMKDPQTQLLSPDLWKNHDSLKTKTPSHIHALTDSTILLGFAEIPFEHNEGQRSITYVDYDYSDQRLGQLYFNIPDVKRAWGKPRKVGETQIYPWKRFPFFGRIQVDSDPDGNYYISDLSEFRINKYSLSGDQITTFEYPYNASELSRSDALASVNESQRDLAEEVKLKDHWPVINRMYTDDQSRLWVSTFGESDEVLYWWVISSSGEIIAQFEWAGKKTRDMFSNENQVVVQGEHFYKYINDPETSDECIVKYRYTFED